MSGRRLILLMSVSLDGFVARRDGVIEWLRRGRASTATSATARTSRCSARSGSSWSAAASTRTCPRLVDLGQPDGAGS